MGSTPNRDMGTILYAGNFTMATIFRKILCPVDFSENSIAALDRAAELAQQNDALLFVMHVEFVPMNSPSELAQYSNVSMEPDQRKLERIAAAHLANMQHQLLVRSGWPGGEIVSAARELDADLVVIATHGWWTGVERRLGNTAEHVIRTSPSSVLSFANGTKIGALKRILCPIDFDENSMAALKFARPLADEYRATISLLHIVPASIKTSGVLPQPSATEWDEDTRTQLAKIAAENLADARRELVVRRGDPGEMILEAVKELHSDLVVMATHGRTGLSYLFLGSVAARVVSESTVPVLTIRGRQ